MKLSDFLSTERILVPLAVRTLPEASEALLACVESSAAVRDARKLRRRIDEARSEDLVSIGGRAFVFHYRAESVGALRVALGVAPEPLARASSADEHIRARIVVLVVAPPREAARHLQVVRAFARVLSQREVLDALHAASRPDDVTALAAFEAFIVPEELTVRDLMTERPRTTRPEMSLREAAREMLSAGLSALPVVDEDGGLLGLLSERELMRHFITTTLPASSRFTPPSAHGRRTVRDVMTRQVLCVAPEQSLADVAALMTNKDVERVPVVRGGRLVGFLTRGDIVRKLIAP